MELRQKFGPPELVGVAADLGPAKLLAQGRRGSLHVLKPSLVSLDLPSQRAELARAGFTA